MGHAECPPGAQETRRMNNIKFEYCLMRDGVSSPLIGTIQSFSLDGRTHIIWGDSIPDFQSKMARYRHCESRHFFTPCRDVAISSSEFGQAVIFLLEPGDCFASRFNLPISSGWSRNDTQLFYYSNSHHPPTVWRGHWYKSQVNSNGAQATDRAKRKVPLRP